MFNIFNCKLMPFLLIFLVIFSPRAHATLQVFPTRVVFTGKKKNDRLNLRNRSNIDKRYRISLVFYRQNKEGEFVKLNKKEIKESDRSAISLLRYSPKVVSLGPNQQQTVRIKLRKRKKGKGDLRAHIRFEEIQKELSQEINVKNSQGVELKLQARFSISVPIIIKDAKSSAKVTIRPIKFIAAKSGEKAKVRLNLRKVGNGFSQGILKFLFKGKEVGIIKRVSIYADDVTKDYPVTNVDKVNLNKGDLKIEYYEGEGSSITKTDEKVIKI